MKKYLIFFLFLLTSFIASIFNANSPTYAAVTERLDIWDVDRSHIVKWTLWSFNSDVQLTTVNDQNERWVQTGFSGFAEGEYRRLSHPSLGHLGFVAGSTYKNRFGLICRNYVIRIETTEDAYPAMACFYNNSWRYARSVF